MKSLIKLSVIILILTTGISSCKKTTKGLMPTVTGQSGEVIVLCSNSLYEGVVGDSVKAIFNDIQVGMPQDESVMDLYHLNHENFTSVYKTQRSILEIKVAMTLPIKNLFDVRFIVEPIFIILDPKTKATSPTSCVDNSTHSSKVVAKSASKYAMFRYS